MGSHWQRRMREGLFSSKVLNSVQYRFVCHCVIVNSTGAVTGADLFIEEKRFFKFKYFYILNSIKKKFVSIIT